MSNRSKRMNSLLIGSIILLTATILSARYDPSGYSPNCPANNGFGCTTHPYGTLEMIFFAPTVILLIVALAISLRLSFRRTPRELPVPP